MTSANNTEIDVEAYLKNEKKIYEQSMKDPRLLLLGPSDSGKSTLLKQMKIIHLNGFSEQEKESAKVNILNGVISYLSKIARSRESADQNMAENATVNRMADSLVLFEQICNHPLLTKNNFVLFLNKKDIFEKKVKAVSIRNTFPEYDGKPGSVSMGISFFKKKFESQVKVKHALVTHVTCCTDTKAMAIIISSLIRVSQSPKPMNIEEYLKKEKKEYMLRQKEPRLLLLGSSDSGKSTLIKQLKILHMNGFTNEERMFAKANIINGIMEAMRKLLQKLGNNMKEIHREVHDFTERWPTPDRRFSEDICNKIVEIWIEKQIQDLINVAQIPENTEYFMSHLNRIREPDYIPTDLDILNLRTVTTNISETVFEYKNKKYHFFDVSGLSYHRKFWISYFDQVHTILFVVSLASYDQYMVEDNTVNRMTDSLVLFEQMINHPLLETQSFVLFLNKKDLFEKKVRQIPIHINFPEYDGKPNSNSQGLRFFRNKFVHQYKGQKDIITHITCCTDTQSMSIIISSLILTSPKMSASPKLNRHKDVEQYLKSEKKQFLEWQKEPKLLILGASDCGKSTLIKQLKIMHLNGFTDDEKASARINILNGLIISINKAISHINNPTKYAKMLEFVNEWPTQDYIIPVEIADIILEIWKSQEIQDIIISLQIPETTDYFVNDIHRLVQPSYIPTNLDILNLRTITMNISETSFMYKGKKFHFFDVSGLSYHRKFWIAYFDCVHTILFVISLASYDQVMIEDSSKNRMGDSIALFADIVNHPLLFKQNFVLFMNKKDLFEKKVKSIPIRKYFPEFDGKQHSASHGIKFFKNKFLTQVKEEKDITTLVTCCTDTETMSVIITSLM
ncbi:hypothetical protein HDV06_004321 [Boothiomyces sp. JEL0866]|nr:hypothetical protein HDV06_004321 [Boothiomyces sp. JEL0866]